MATITDVRDLIDYLRGAFLTSDMWHGEGVSITISAFTVLKTMTPEDPKLSWDELVKSGKMVIVPDDSQSVPVRPLIGTSLPPPPPTGTKAANTPFLAGATKVEDEDEQVLKDTDRYLGGPKPSPSPSPSPSGGGGGGGGGSLIDFIRRFFELA